MIFPLGRHLPYLSFLLIFDTSSRHTVFAQSKCDCDLKPLSFLMYSNLLIYFSQAIYSLKSRKIVSVCWCDFEPSTKRIDFNSFIFIIFFRTILFAPDKRNKSHPATVFLSKFFFCFFVSNHFVCCCCHCLETNIGADYLFLCKTKKKRSIDFVVLASGVFFLPHSNDMHTTFKWYTSCIRGMKNSSTISCIVFD